MADRKCKAPALGMGVKLIEALSDTLTPLGLSEIARAAGTNKNMAARLLSTLLEEGWIESVEPGPRYSLTLKPFAIASRALAAKPLLELARPELRELWEKSGESVYLAVHRDGKALYLEHYDATGPIKLAGRVGGEYPLHCSAPGKALLAHLGEEAFRKLLSGGLEKMGPGSIVEENALRKELEATRKRGYAVDNEEIGRGILCVAAPVFDRNGELCAAIGMSATTIAYSMASFEGKMAPLVMKAAGGISSKLGFRNAQRVKNN